MTDTFKKSGVKSNNTLTKQKRTIVYSKSTNTGENSLKIQHSTGIKACFLNISTNPEA